MRGDFLMRSPADVANKAWGEMVGILAFIRAYGVQIGVVRKTRIAIGRADRGQASKEFVTTVAEEESDCRPGAAKFVMIEQVKHPRNHVAHSKDVAAIIGNRAGIIDAPHKLKIQRQDKASPVAHSTYP